MKNEKRSPTAINVAPLEEASALRTWVQRYWKVGVAVSAAGAIAILYWQHSRQQRLLAQRSGWERLRSVTQEDPGSGMLTGTVADLAVVQSDLKDTDAGPWVSYLLATNAAKAGEYETALRSLDSLDTGRADHALLATQFEYSSGTRATAVNELRERIRAQASRAKPVHPDMGSTLATPPVEDATPR